MNYSADIKDEAEGAKHYEQMASKDRKDRIALKSMSVDERKHEEMLKEMSKSKALKKKIK